MGVRKMLRSVKEIINYVIQAKDGEIGRCKDFLFDDDYWTIRYMVAETGKWLPGRKVLISPISLGDPEGLDHRFTVNLTKEQIKSSPPIDEHAPVSRQYEKKYFDHYYWPYYWAGPGVWGAPPYPIPMPVRQPEAVEETEDGDRDENHLRSVKEVTGYHIQAVDGHIGHVEDYIVDEETWTIRYMVVDTRNWLPGRKVLVTPYWIKSVDWAGNTVEVDLTTEAVKESPHYNPSEPVNREYEIQLYDYYGRPTYWK
jgi:hypothetical protein